jgi:hypothetical protein
MIKKDKRLLMKKVFDQMPNRFTSYEFKWKCEQEGLFMGDTRSGSISVFLSRYCRNEGYMSRTWVKPPTGARVIKRKSDAMQLAFDKLPNRFRSRDFYKILRDLGFAARSGDNTSFLYNRSNYLGGRIWEKKNNDSTNQEMPLPPKNKIEIQNKESQDMDIKRAIFFLKENGYKVLRPDVQYNEV